MRSLAGVLYREVELYRRVQLPVRARPEQKLQDQIVYYLQWALTLPALFTSFPAGGGGLARGRTLKPAGLRAGMPDLMILSIRRAYFVELKAANGVLSE